jgi:CRISPR-associated protein Cmr4
MFKETKPLFLMCETPLHAGSGSDLGIVDLPIQREKHTGFPKIEASSLKGAIRQVFESRTVLSENDTAKAQKNLIAINKIFGFDEAVLRGNNLSHANEFGEDTQFSGCLAVSDARLLLFPVKSLYGVFAWVTCPKIINRFIQDMNIAGIKTDIEDKQLATNSIAISEESGVVGNNTLQLEEFAFKNPQKNAHIKVLGTWLKNKLLGEADKSYWAEKLQKDIVVLNDTDFGHLVSLSTEVITRTKIDNQTGTVAAGALFTEEYLPAESVMYTLVMFADDMSKTKDKMTADKVKAFFKQNLPEVMQIGANATLGKGIVKTKLIDDNTTQDKGGTQ